MQKGALQTGLDLEAEKGRGALKSPCKGFAPMEGGGYEVRERQYIGHERSPSHLPIVVRKGIQL